ncbi:DUF5777 family beta-barrel protein [Aureivirga marina]|uniref:DUF5777 family beta-barrel protein n=1 Tax=Aureivirga marina TaxID=1182451 RepID=UPI0018CA5226|nr:DUF5777 family beta-barrel protein [Aureivirga marina]
MKYRILLILFLYIIKLNAQSDLLDELESETLQEEKDKFYYPAFKAMKIGNLQSTKIASKRDFYLYVSHRFGSLEDGFETFFGFDNANTKIELVYGFLENFQIGISRESVRKTYAGSLKFRLLKQNEKFPFNIVYYSTININSELKKERYPLLDFKDRLSFANQILISNRLNNYISLELAPTIIRQNLVYEPFQKHDQFALGAGGRIRLSKRMSFNIDYVYNFSRHEKSIYKNPLTIGIDIETGGHIFQLLFTNAQSTNEPGFISNAEGNWEDGDIFFGFNIVRVF